MHVNRGMEGGHPKCLQMPTGGEEYHASCVRTHLHYLFLCFCVMVSYTNKSPFQYVFLFYLGTLYFRHFNSSFFHSSVKGCHILYVFGFNSKVCSHIVGVHLV